MTEYAEVTKAAVDLLNAHPKVAYAWKQSVGVYRGAGGTRVTVAPPGLPDVCGWMKDGRFIGIEVKRKNSDARMSQAQLDVQHLLSISRCVRGTITSPEQAREIVEAA